MSFLKRIFRKTTQNEQIALFESNTTKIYPWIKVIFTDDNPQDASTQIELSNDDSPIFKPWLGDLAIFYVIDMGDSFQVLLNRHLPSKISKEQLHQLAIRNLNGQIGYEIHTTKDDWKMLAAGGDHEAGFICVPYIWDQLAEELNSNLVISISAKDMVLIVPEYDFKKISDLKNFVHKHFKDWQRPLSKKLFKFDRHQKQWKIFDEAN